MGLPKSRQVGPSATGWTRAVQVYAVVPPSISEKITRREGEALGLVGLARHLDIRGGDDEVYCNDEGEQALEIQRKHDMRKA